MPVSLEERSKISHELKRMGFGGIQDPNLFAQIATLYKTHDSFRGLLMSTKPDQRRIAYESLKPHLCFVAKPLDVYEREVKEKAEREQWDVIDPSNPHFPQAFKVGEIESPEYKLEKLATQAIKASEAKGHLFLLCDRCTREQGYAGTDRVQAFKDAQADGWQVNKLGDEVETRCPGCAPKVILQ